MMEICNFHCHFLPGIDDGAENKEVSSYILETEKSYGISNFVATPHYYFYKKSVPDFISDRAKAYEEMITEKDCGIKLAAEVRVEQGISDTEGLKELCYPGTSYLLLEMPMARISNVLVDEIYNIMYKYHVKPVFAHIERYLGVFGKNDYDTLLSFDGAVYQFNLYSLCRFGTKRLFKRFYSEGCDIVIGTDSHGNDERLKNAKKGLDSLRKMVSPEDFEYITGGKAVGIDFNS